ncbi:MAG TPA: condensation domain-containing protein [Candidatus Bathyarchaeia archaeon]|nr:condensation domain-containing protein [Candidatus Bathyarchaeia archaeon]
MQRELNDLEYLNYSIGQPYNLVVSLHIKGDLTEKLLKEALMKMQYRHPLLSVRLKEIEKDIPWFSSEGVEEIPIKTIIRKSEFDTKEEFHKQLITPFDYSLIKSPLFRVTLIKSDIDSNLILCSQHTITDGLSMAFLIRDLITYLNNPNMKVEILDAPAKDDDIFSPKVRRSIAKTAIRAKIILRLLKIYHFFAFGFGKRKKILVKQKESKHTDLEVYSWTLSEKQTEEFLLKCKEKGISVHSAICTAFLPDINIILNPVDLRRRLNYPIGESFGLYAGGTVFSLKYRNRKNFWYNARRFQRKLIWNLRDRKIYSINRLLNKALPLPLMQNLGILFTDIVSKTTPFALTNLRSLDKLGITFESDKFSVESFNAAISNTLDGMTVVVYTLRNKMHFHFNYMDTIHDFEKIKQISKNVLKRILTS